VLVWPSGGQVRDKVPSQDNGFSRTLETALEVNLVQKKVALAEKLSTFSDHFAPRTVARFNNCDIIVVKAKGEFVWHAHDDTDDFFLVLAGRLVIQLRDGEVALGPGELFIVPRGVEHRPVAEEEAHLLLIEPTGTPNTGEPTTAAAHRAV